MFIYVDVVTDWSLSHLEVGTQANFLNTITCIEFVFFFESLILLTPKRYSVSLVYHISKMWGLRKQRQKREGVLVCCHNVLGCMCLVRTEVKTKRGPIAKRT